MSSGTKRVRQIIRKEHKKSILSQFSDHSIGPLCVSQHEIHKYGSLCIPQRQIHCLQSQNPMTPRFWSQGASGRGICIWSFSIQRMAPTLPQFGDMYNTPRKRGVVFDGWQMLDRAVDGTIKRTTRMGEPRLSEGRRRTRTPLAKNKTSEAISVHPVGFWY